MDSKKQCDLSSCSSQDELRARVLDAQTSSRYLSARSTDWMEFLDLPNELILELGDLAEPPALCALAATCRRLHSLLNPLLYRRNAQERDSSALIWAAENGRVETVNFCLSNGADVNTAKPWKEDSRYTIYPLSGTPLHYAVRGGHDDLVRYLLANGADPQRSCTYLCNCSVPKRILITLNTEAPLLTSHFSPLHVAICSGHTSIAKTLIDWGVSCESILQLRWRHGPMAHQLQPAPMNLMHEVAVHGNLDVLNHLIFSTNRVETMINAAAFDGNTPLHYLALSWPPGSADLFDRFLSLNPNLDVPNNDLLRPIDCFVDKGNARAAQRLLQLGSRPYQFIRCIQSACKMRLPNLGISREAKNQLIQERNDLVLSLINHALNTGQLTRDVRGDRRISLGWYGIFQRACLHPSLLRELLRAGFRPDSLTGEDSVLLKVIETLTSKRMSNQMTGSLLEATRMLTRAGQRWDRKGHEHKTPLGQLVNESEFTAPKLRVALFKSLLGSRPPEQTGAEQAHLNQLGRYALENGQMEVYRLLVRHGAKHPWVHRGPEKGKGNRATVHQGLVALQWFKPDLKLVTANRLGKGLGRFV